MSAYYGAYHIERDGDLVRMDFEEFHMWRKDNPEEFDRQHRIGLDEINGKRVSTVMLFLDHAYGGGPPLVYETMVFPGGSWCEEDGERYRTREDAIAGHARFVALVAASIPVQDEDTP